VKPGLQTKLTVFSLLLMAFSLAALNVLVRYFVYKTVEEEAQKENALINSISTAETKEYINSKKRTLTNLILETDGLDTDKKNQFYNLYFEVNKDIAAFCIGDDIFINPIWNDAANLNDTKNFKRRGAHGTVRLINAQKYFLREPVIALLFGENAVLFFSAAYLSETYTAGANVSALTNRGGDDLISAGLIEGDVFVNTTEVPELDAVISTVISRDIVFEAADATVKRNIYLSFGVLSLGFVFVWDFVLAVKKPIFELQSAAQNIEGGNNNVKIKNKSWDETGVLSKSVLSMSYALTNFEKFTNKALALLARQGKLEAGGVERRATIFFSDIRGFTAISEKMTPREVIEFLNQYMEKMASCVLLTDGVIDKFIGDAVFAHWGAVTSAGSDKDDAINGVCASLMMRAALASFNIGRGEDEKKPVIKIGCGLNSGRLIAGQIGSSERLEYTVIGNAVSFADRTETFNKGYGTQILISENVYELCGNLFMLEEMPPVKSKGKDVRIFAVINVLDEVLEERIFTLLKKVPGVDIEHARKFVGKDAPKTLTALRSLLDIAVPDLSQVNTDEEEKKYKIREAV